MLKKLPQTAAILLLVACGAIAAAPSTDDQLLRIKQQLTDEQKALESKDLKRLIVIERQKLEEQLKRLEALEAKVAQLDSGGTGKPKEVKKPKPLPTAVAAKPAPKTSTAEKRPVGEQQKEQSRKQHASEARKVAAVSDDVRGILTPRGTLTLEPSLKYAASSTDRVFLEGFGPLVLPSFFLGVIDIRETDRKSIIGALTARYGITNRLQVEGKLPYVWRDDSTRSRPISRALFEDDVFEADGQGLGDLEVALDYQFNSGAGGWPFITGSLRVKAPTGTDPYSVESFEVVPTDAEGDCFTAEGSDECLVQRFPRELATGTGTWSVQPSLTALYPTDPAVFFGTIDYSINLEEDFGGDVGNIDPGDAFGISGGMGFGINDRSSFSIGFSYKHGFETKQQGVTLNGSDYDIGQILFGYSFRWSKETNVNLSVGIGATDDAQDFELSLRVPMNFTL